jgi:DNA-binding NtrC family response regulator
MKINILIVDNDALIIKVLADFLSKDSRFNVLTALNGKAAIEIVEKHKVELVISDLKMPEMNGIELLSTLRKDLPEIKAIILTGHSDIDSYIETMELGAFEYLNKPVDLHLLKEVIDKLL